MKMLKTGSGEAFFTENLFFYKRFFSLMVMVLLQNIAAYTVNMADNIMLGNYSQNSLSAAAAVNQIFFIVQQIALAVGEGFIVIGSQYWGQKRTEPLCHLAGTALKTGMFFGIAIAAGCSAFPQAIMELFTKDPAVTAQGMEYMVILKYTFVLFIITNVLLAVLRCVETVKISIFASFITLLINICGNYLLIYGNWGFPRLGIRGAGIATLIARIGELAIVLVYIFKFDTKIKLTVRKILKTDRSLRRDYIKVEIPVMLSQLLWAVAVPLQTALLGHMSSEAMAANSIATTFYQYLKVIVMAVSSASAVMIGSAVGSGDREKVRSEARTLSVFDAGIGVILGSALFLLKEPLLGLYSLTENTRTLASQMMTVMSIVMAGMSYQMPVSSGILRGGGDTGFFMMMNLICTWGVVIPLSFIGVFWWQCSAVETVILIQSDQIFKVVPVFLRFCSYKWIKRLA